MIYDLHWSKKWQQIEGFFATWREAIKMKNEPSSSKCSGSRVLIFKRFNEFVIKNLYQIKYYTNEELYNENNSTADYKCVFFSYFFILGASQISTQIREAFQVVLEKMSYISSPCR